jgi:hypothetical protein
MSVAKRTGLSVGVVLALVGGLSTWLVSALFSPKPPPSMEERFLLKARTYNARYDEAVEFTRRFAR